MTADLERFVAAQDPVWDQVTAELRAGRKESHWMWFVFPQLAGLGRSEMARRYAIGSLQEARAYLAHPVLGPRLDQVIRLLLAIEGRTADEVLGPMDARKLHSSMSLFHRADPSASSFRAVLGQWFGGRPDALTDTLLGQG